EAQVAGIGAQARIAGGQVDGRPSVAAVAVKGRHPPAGAGVAVGLAGTVDQDHVVGLGPLGPLAVVGGAVLAAEGSGGTEKEVAIGDEGDIALVGVAVAAAAVASGEGDQGHITRGAVDVAVEGEVARVAEMTAVPGRSGIRGVGAGEGRTDDVEEVELVVLGLDGRGEGARLGWAEAFGVEAEGILGAEAGPFRIVGAAPVAVAEGSAFPV